MTAISEPAPISAPPVGKIHSVVRSELFWTAIKAFALGGRSFVAVMFYPSIKIPFLLNPVPTLLLAGGISIGILLIEVIRHRKQLIFEISLIFTIVSSKAWWNEVTDKIVLGAIPLKHHFDDLKNRVKIDAVLTLLEPFELDNGLIEPIKEWPGIERKHIHARDFYGVPADQIEEGVSFIDTQIKAGKRVYVHCKAGKGRSATIVVAYLLRTKQFDTLAKAYAFVKTKRVINLNADQQRAITVWLKTQPTS